ncbi:hypothetical protein U1Q18_045674 [Sarracenia purpurea var. burkii]
MWEQNARRQYERTICYRSAASFTLERTSVANDDGDGVRALKAFFEMKGFSSVEEAVRIGPHHRLCGTATSFTLERTSVADDDSDGVRALKTFFEMKGFTSVAEAVRIGLAVLAGTTRVWAITDDGGFVGGRWMAAMANGVP